MSIINLRGLHESQTGKYLCRHYNEKHDNNSYAISSYFDVFVPGNVTFNGITNIQFVNKTAPQVDIHCPVTNPDLHVRLYKLNEKLYNRTKEVVWKPIYANYEPTQGFRLHAGLGRELPGVYKCTADNGVSIVSIAADHSEEAHYNATLTSSTINPCFENYKLVQYVRSKRLECYCKDSYGLFMNDNFEFENRQASCAMNAIDKIIQNCSDWRLNDFFGNGEESPEVCFGETQPGLVEGSGSRPSLKVRGKTFPDGDAQRNFSFTKLSITYNGFVDWAGDFTLAICRKEICQLSRNGSSEDLEYIENEPTKTQYYPMAHQQAVWSDVEVDGTDVKVVYVFQAHSLSYAWFPYASAEINWGIMGEEEDSESFAGQFVKP